MDKYSISQTPTGKGKGKASRTKSRSSARRQSRSLSPQLVLGGIVLVAALVLAALVWMHFFANSPEVANGNSNARTPNKTTSLPASKRDAVTTAIQDKQPNDLGHYYASKVHVVMPGFDRWLSADEVTKIISSSLNGAQAPWNWHVPPGDLSSWQTGPYGDNFTGNVVVGISDDGTVISVGFDDNGNIDTVFIAPVGDLTPAGSGGGSSTGPSSTPSNGGTTPDTPTSPATDPRSLPYSD